MPRHKLRAIAAEEICLEAFLIVNVAFQTDYSQYDDRAGESDPYPECWSSLQSE